MNLKLSKICAGMAASLTLLAVNPTVYAQDTYTRDAGTGGGVKDPFGECIRSIGGAIIPECNPTPVAPVPVPAPIVLSLAADTTFEFDRYDLKPGGEAALERLVEDMNRAERIDGIDIVGHTDSVGSASYNQALSERRASTVREFLVARGVSPSLINARGMGLTQPIATNETPEGRAQNRRVEITVDAKKVQQ